MDWARTHLYVRFTTGLSGNPALMKKIDRQLRRAQGDYKRLGQDIRRYYSFDYKAKSWNCRQRVIAKIEVTSKGVNVRFIVTSNGKTGADWDSAPEQTGTLLMRQS